VAPLTTLLKNNSFTWTLVNDDAFQELKKTMCTTPVLALPDFTKTFSLECDAFGKGIGVVLMQEGIPLAFTKKKFCQTTIWANQSMKRKCFYSTCSRSLVPLTLGTMI
jgi:hypothetical protein